jgi:hypothetical protein
VHCNKICFSHSYWDSFCFRSLSMIRAVRQRTSVPLINSNSPAIETNAET